MTDKDNTNSKPKLKNPGNVFGADNQNARKVRGGTPQDDQEAESQVSPNEAITGGVGSGGKGGSGGQGGGSQGGGGQGDLKGQSGDRQ